MSAAGAPGLHCALDELTSKGRGRRSGRGGSSRSGPYEARSSKGRSSLVEKVREAQRSSLQWVQAWRAFCDEEGSGDYDPARYEDPFLQRALSEINETHGSTSQRWERSSEASGSLLSKRSSGAGLGRSGGHAALVEEVKGWQRADPSHGEEWRRYCDQYGDGTYNPSRLSADFIETALGELRGGSRSGWSRGGAPGTSQAQLVEEIKEWQRTSRDISVAWRTYVDRNSGDDWLPYDPSKHNAAFLRAALKELRSGWANSAPSAPSGSGKGRDTLVDQVREWQRADKRNGELWRKYCEDYGDGTYNLTSHDAAFLRRAVADLGCGRDPDLSRSTASMLVERVKELQRSSMDLTKAWREYCDQYGGGYYNPAACEAEFLFAWLMEVDSGGS